MRPEVGGSNPPRATKEGPINMIEEESYEEVLLSEEQYDEWMNIQRHPPRDLSSLLDLFERDSPFEDKDQES